jgi:aryl-alcohol dehydrogenase-like predicted oxidoreductase
MGFSQSYGPAVDKESKKTLAKAIEVGCTFWDTAVVYGAGHNETLLGEFFRESGTRDKVFVASKCGFQVGSLRAICCMLSAELDLAGAG